MANILLDKFKKNTTIKESSVLSNSKFFKPKQYVDTGIPALNIALSGRLDGGLASGLQMWAAPSKHFKTAFTLVLAKAYLDTHKDSICIFYDSEFGSPPAYFKTFGIDTDRVLHTPITNIEELKFDLVKQLTAIERGEKVVIVIDSVGNLASKKEVEDALNENTAADMTRAKQLKSLWRIVTPHLTLKDVPMIVVNHVYDEQKLYGRQIMSGGTGGMLSSDNVFFVGKQQNKEDGELQGFNFVIEIEKSRFVKERAKIPITVSFEGGINKWSGLMEIALESGHVVKPKNGWYARVINGVQEEKSYRLANTDNKDFWNDIIKDNKFAEFIREKYALSEIEMLQQEEKSKNEVEEEEEVE